MRRVILEQLVQWKDEEDRLPLLIRGARQVGKTFVIEEFCERYFAESLQINFEQQPEYKACFESLYPEKILKMIYALSGKTVTPGKTILFLDEIQECPQAIVALRYFYEQMPDLHVIAAGSLLEFVMRDTEFSMPVGRVQSYYMKPLSFIEFLYAADKFSLIDYIQNVTINSGIEDVIHQELLAQLKEYFVLGGMPAVLNNYFHQHNFEKVQIRQNIILETYRRDFSKYAKDTDIKYLQRLFDKAPGMIAKHFKYVDVDPDFYARDLKRALADLKDAGVIYANHACSASGLPLVSTINEKKFKLLFLDIGLVNNAAHLGASILLSDNVITLNNGTAAEQFVGQELLAYAPCYREEQLYYWEREKRGSTAEVDYVIAIDSTILPVEVKAGSTGRMRSIQMFMDEKGLDFGIRISQNTLGFEKRILSIPLYMISELPRLVKSIL